LRFEPSENIGVDANRQRLFKRPVELPSDGIAPIGLFRNVLRRVGTKEAGMPAERAFSEGDGGLRASRNNAGSQNVAQNKGFIFPEGVLAKMYATETKRVIASISDEGDNEGWRHILYSALRSRVSELDDSQWPDDPITRSPDSFRHYVIRNRTKVPFLSAKLSDSKPSVAPRNPNCPTFSFAVTLSVF
jgi:hypothetical protein